MIFILKLENDESKSSSGALRQSNYAKVSFDDSTYFEHKYCMTEKRSDSMDTVSGKLKTISLDNVRYVEGQVNSSPQSPAGLEASQSDLTTKSSRISFQNKESLDRNLEQIDNESLPEHLKIGKEFTFRIIILEVADISPEYFDIFCQFNFMHRNNEAFSTEPLPNTGKGPPLGFFHIQYFTVTITRSFIDYIRNQPILFEVLGHYHHHPLHNHAINSSTM